MNSGGMFSFKIQSVKYQTVQIPKNPVPFYLFNLRQEMNRKKRNPDGLVKAKYELTCRLLWPTPKISTSESKATTPKVILYKYKLQKKMNVSARSLRDKKDSRIEKKMQRLRLISG